MPGDLGHAEDEVHADAEEQSIHQVSEIPRGAESVHRKQEHDEIARSRPESLCTVVFAAECDLGILRRDGGGEGHDDVHHGGAHIHEGALLNAPEQGQAADERHEDHDDGEHQHRQRLSLGVGVDEVVHGASVGGRLGAAVVHVGFSERCGDIRYPEYHRHERQSDDGGQEHCQRHQVCFSFVVHVLFLRSVWFGFPFSVGKLFLVHESAERGAKQNRDVHEEVPVLYVLHVELYPLLYRGIAAVAVYLCQSGHAGLYLVLYHVHGDFILEVVHIERNLGARSDKAHVALEDVDQLRQLVDGEFPDKCAELSAPGVVLRGPGGVLFRAVAHGAQLVHGEYLLV